MLLTTQEIHNIQKSLENIEYINRTRAENRYNHEIEQVRIAVAALIDKAKEEAGLATKIRSAATSGLNVSMFFTKPYGQHYESAITQLKKDFELCNNMMQLRQIYNALPHTGPKAQFIEANINNPAMYKELWKAVNDLRRNVKNEK